MESRAGSRLASIAAKTASECEASAQRTFTLHTKSPHLRFITFGDQGTGTGAQRNVACHLNALCADPATRPDFILVLGDNIYEWGANAADDPNFMKYFDNIYLDLPHLQKIPFFLIPGNHDENFQNSATASVVNEKGITRIMHQVAHTYMADKHFTADEKKRIFSHSELDLSDLPAWVMPRRYQSLIANDVQIFCIDSNTYVDEYIHLEAERLYLTHDEDPNEWLHGKANTNQAAWLACTVREARAAGRKIILSQHHPLYTPGKRGYERLIHNDLGIYLSDTRIRALRHMLNMPNACSETPYNLCLVECYRQQNLHFDLVLAAHDHNIYNYHNKHDAEAPYRFCQLVVGSGGGELQDRNRFSEQRMMGCFLKQTGVAIVNHQAGDEHFTYSIRTSDKQYHLEFNTMTPHAIVNWDENNPDNDETFDFFTVVENAIHAYFDFLSTKQDQHQGRFFSLLRNISHGNAGAERAHQLWAYIKNYQPQLFTTAVHIVHERTKRDWLDNAPAEHSLITLLNQAMYKKYKKDMETFAAEVARRPIRWDARLKM